MGLRWWDQFAFVEVDLQTNPGEFLLDGVPCFLELYRCANEATIVEVPEGEGGSGGMLKATEARKKGEGEEERAEGVSLLHPA